MEDLVFCVQTLTSSSSLNIEQGLHYRYTIRADSVSHAYRNDMLDNSRNVFGRLGAALGELSRRFPELRHRLALRYIGLCLETIANEAHPDNRRSICDKIRLVWSLCEDQRLQDSVQSVDNRVHTLRARSVLAALRRQWVVYPFLYYRLRNLLVRLRRLLCR